MIQLQINLILTFPSKREPPLQKLPQPRIPSNTTSSNIPLTSIPGTTQKESSIHNLSPIAISNCIPRVENPKTQLMLKTPNRERRLLGAGDRNMEMQGSSALCITEKSLVHSDPQTRRNLSSYWQCIRVWERLLTCPNSSTEHRMQ